MAVVGSVGGAAMFDNVNPLTPVLPNLYVTVIGWEHSPKEIYIERNIW